MKRTSVLSAAVAAMLRRGKGWDGDGYAAPELVVNDASTPSQLQINMYAAVNSKQITRQQADGRDYYVVPSYTLPANVVMNRILYPADQIDAHYQGLEGTLAPLGHPVVNGAPVAAATQQGLVNYCGAANRNVQKVGDRIYLEKWVDIEQAKLSPNGQRLISRIEGIVNGTDTKPIHTSVALFINRIAANAPNGEYDWRAQFIKMDHDAILLDEPGAATPDQGVGMVVNCSDATQLHINEGMLQGESFRTRERMLQDAAREQFNPAGDNWVYAADFTQTQVVLVIEGKAELRGYTIESGKVKFDTAAIPVIEKSFWAPVVNRVKQIFNQQAQKPAKSESSEMNAEERAALVQDLGAAFAAALKPVSDGVTALAANQQAMADQLKNAPQMAKEADMRKDVAAVHGEVVANQLSGEALAQMHAALKTTADAARLAPNSQDPAKPAPVDMATHFNFTK